MFHARIDKLIRIGRKQQKRLIIVHAVLRYHFVFLMQLHN
jgi:hypothetical protein